MAEDEKRSRPAERLLEDARRSVDKPSLAVALCQEAHRADPDWIQPISLMLDLLALQDRWDRMGEWADKGLKLAPHDPTLLTARAITLDLSGEHDIACQYWCRAVKLTGGLPTQGRYRQALSLLYSGDARRALQILQSLPDSALENETPNVIASVRSSIGEAYLRMGQVQGFAFYCERDRSDGASYALPSIPTWQGEDLREKSLLITHHLGYGDQLLLGPLAATLRPRCARLAITCDHVLLGLFRSSFPDVDWHALDGPVRVADPAPDELLNIVIATKPDVYHSLLGACSHLSDEEVRRGFQLRLSPAAGEMTKMRHMAQALRKQHPGKRLVGLAFDTVRHRLATWPAGHRAFAFRKSIPLEIVSQLAGDPAMAQKAHFVLMHPREHLNLIGVFPENCSAVDLSDFAQTASLALSLDEIVAIDSCVATMVCMLGRPVHVLLNTAGDWRWGQEGRSSPWLECAQIYRQPAPGAWVPVIQDLKRALMQRLAGNCSH